ncbi:MAG: hypothetical protein KKB22_00205, partial [Candidatus Omnitrophica bacterium]|nr:hypothetical protein [Candidatus Omnitrophota bacterium]
PDESGLSIPPTGTYLHGLHFLLDAAKTFAAQENWQIRDKVIHKIACAEPVEASNLSGIFWLEYP